MSDGRWSMGPSYNVSMRVFARWLALDRRAKRLSIEALLLAALAIVRLKVEGAPRLLRAAASPRHPSSRPDDLRDLSVAIERASRYLPGATCLTRALALKWMLRRRGIPADVRLGARTEAGDLFAHAWVECQGIMLGGPAAGDPFATLR